MAAKHRLTFHLRSGGVSDYEPRVKAGAVIFAHSIVGLTATGEAVPARKPDAVAALGIAQHNASAADGRVTVKTGCFNGKEGFSARPVPADIRKPVYATDDDTLTLTNGASALLLGHIEAVDDEGVWIRI